jgi:polyhydroxybutyrate depolymerase
MRSAGIALAVATVSLFVGCGDDGGAGGGGNGTGANGATSSSDGGAGSTTSSSDGGATTSSSQGGASSTNGSGGGATCSGKTGAAGDTPYMVLADGEMRSFRVHAPPGYDGTNALPVVFVFHGYTETADQIEDITKMTPEADARGYIVVYAQGLNNSWNAGNCCGSSGTNDVDDDAFALVMLDTLASDYCVDDKRIFTSGFSNGGMLSHRFGCELSDRFAALGPVSGTMALDACTPSRPVPVMSFHGTSDFVVPYADGGFSGGEGAVQTSTEWAARNGCDATSTVTFSQGDASCETWSNCDAGADVTLCTLTNGGHQWPGGNSAGPAGTINMDIFASAALLDFFDAHPMP